MFRKPEDLKNRINAALIIINQSLADNNMDSFERRTLEDTSKILQAGRISDAIIELAAGLAHSHREGWVEDRSEAQACKCALDALVD